VIKFKNSGGTDLSGNAVSVQLLVGFSDRINQTDLDALRYMQNHK
jgi:hypothetical protein